MKTPLALSSENPLLIALEKHYKRLTDKERSWWLSRVDYYDRLILPILREHTALYASVRKLKSEIQLQTKGVPSTEAISNDVMSMNPVRQDSANRFLLKKAYRMAAAVAHPDKGGSHDDFLSIHKAYRAGDMSSLNEYVLSRRLGLLERIKYWDDERRKPRIKHQLFQATDAFRIVQYIALGQHEQAVALGELLLKHMILSLQLQLNDLLKEQYHGNEETRGTSSPEQEDSAPSGGSSAGEEGTPSGG